MTTDASRGMGSAGRAVPWFGGFNFSSRLAIAACLLAITAVLILPALAFLLATSLQKGDAGAQVWTLSNYTDLLGDTTLLRLLWNTLVFSFGSSFLSIFTGTVLAFLVTRTDMPLKTVVVATNTFLFAFPVMIYCIGWSLLLSDRGVVTQWLTDLVGAEDPVFTIHSLPGMVLVEGLCWTPLTFFLMVALLGAMDISLEESAYTSGASTRSTIMRVTLPLVAPGIASMFILNFIRGLEAFEVPALIGLPGNVEVLASEVFLLTRRFPPQYGKAAAFAVLLVMFLGLLLLLHRQMMIRVSERFQTIKGKGYKVGEFRLDHWRWPAATAVQTFLFVGFGLPVLSLVWASLLPYYQNPSWRALSFVSLKNFGLVLQGSTLFNAALNSLIVAASAACFTMIISGVAAWVIVRSRSVTASALDLLMTLPLVIPGIVMGLAMLQLSVNLPIPLFGTLALIIIAYVASYLPYGMRYAVPGVMQIHAELEDSAYTCGASEARTLTRIILPLLRPAMLGGALFVFLAAFRELPRALLLQGLNTKLISVKLFDLWTDGQIGELAAFGLIFSVILGVIGMVARRALGGENLK
jgi:iron(III) transport system permease protein